MSIFYKGLVRVKNVFRLVVLKNHHSLCTVVPTSVASNTLGKGKTGFTPQHALEIYILFYPLTLEGRRGTKNDFDRILFHLVLFSAALVERSAIGRAPDS